MSDAALAGPAGHPPGTREGARGPLVHHFADLDQQKEASALGMWIFLVTEIMFFGGFFATYAIYRHLYYDAFAAGSHHLSWKIGFFNTLVLIASSLTMAMAVWSAAVGRSKAIVFFLGLTILLGGTFLGVKYFEYHEKIAPCLGDGPHTGCLVPGPRFDPSVLHLEGEHARQAQIYYSLYFGMTGLHALHMIIGIPILAIIGWMAGRGRFSPGWHTPVELTGLYWHFVDIVWIFLFPLLYLVGHH
jgi:cytochrome c oxidase subunit 3